MTQRQQIQNLAINESGGVVRINNALSSTSGSFTYEVAGSPASVTIILSGCLNDGTQEVLDTQTGAATVAPSLGKTYDYFTVQASWTDGLNVAVTVDATFTGTPAAQPQLNGTSAFFVSVPPATASSSGVPGQFTWDSGFLYMCVATNTWKRVAIATF